MAPPGPGRPTPPLSLHLPAEMVRSRLGREVAVADAFVVRLEATCSEVLTDPESRVEAGRDWWPLSVAWGASGEVPALPAAVARPATAAEVAAVLDLCSRFAVPVTPCAGRSGVCGGSVPVFGGISLDLTGLAGVIGIDDRSLGVDVRAGTFGDLLEAELGAHGLTLGHWPQSVALSTVGGWLACRSAGQYSTRYGKIEDLAVSLEVALADGRVIRTSGRHPRAAHGPDLTQLFVGSEGTLGVITEATLRVRPRPGCEEGSAWGFDSFAVGLDACRRILRRGATPAVLRLYDPAETRRNFSLAGTASLSPAGTALLVVVDEGDPALVAAVSSIVAEECQEGKSLDPGLVDHWRAQRNQLPPLEQVVREGLIADTIEVAGTWGALPAIHADALGALEALDATVVASAHQSHSYLDGGCLYFTFAGSPPAGGADLYYRSAWDAVMAATTSHGGALSHHHGIGINRARHLAGALGPAFDVLDRVKTALDPRRVLNPGKLGLASPFGPPPWP
ncbi:MAG: FAD-binding oxidoreductase [Acidimicrobiales bacterium]